jgi:hypothetical protein
MRGLIGSPERKPPPSRLRRIAQRKQRHQTGQDCSLSPRRILAGDQPNADRHREFRWTSRPCARRLVLWTTLFCPELTTPARIVAWGEAGGCFIWRNYGKENGWSAGSGGRTHHASECPSSADFNATIAGGDELSRLARSDCESGPTIASRQCAAGSTSRTSRDPIGPGFGPARSPSSPPSS